MMVLAEPKKEYLVERLPVSQYHNDVVGVSQLLSVQLASTPMFTRSLSANDLTAD